MRASVKISSYVRATPWLRDSSQTARSGFYMVSRGRPQSSPHDVLSVDFAGFLLSPEEAPLSYDLEESKNYVDVVGSGVAATVWRVRARTAKGNSQERYTTKLVYQKPGATKMIFDEVYVRAGLL